MVAARKREVNGGSTTSESRSKAIAAVQICWKQMRPDLAFDKDASRDERLAWVAGFLGLKNLDSLTKLSDAQLGSVAGEMKRLTGVRSAECGVRSENATEFPSRTAEVIHLASTEQQYTLNILRDHIGWTDEQKENFLFKRYKCRSFRMLTFKQAFAVTMQLLNIAAHRDLKQATPEAKISRDETAKYIPILKKKLGIDQRG